MGDGSRFYEAPVTEARRSAPAALRNREAIMQVLAEWLPPTGIVLELASGTGEHAVFFAEHFPRLQWQPSDIHPDALQSIASWREAAQLPNLRPPIRIDASAADWPLSNVTSAAGAASTEPSSTAGDTRVAAVLSINMVHISPWSAALGLLNGAARLLQPGGKLILYGPWLKTDIPTAPTNLAFDQELRERDPEWGLRKVEDFEVEAQKRGFMLEGVRSMPANNLMLLFRLDGHRD